MIDYRRFRNKSICDTDKSTITRELFLYIRRPDFAIAITQTKYSVLNVINALVYRHVPCIQRSFNVILFNFENISVTMHVISHLTASTILFLYINILKFILVRMS